MVYLIIFKRLKPTTMRLLLPALLLLLFSCKTTTYYVSRHAERSGTMATDPPLTKEGEKQALDLRDYLKGRRIGAVYSTNFTRTKSTAAPTAALYGVPVNIYDAQRSTVLVDSLKAGNRRNVLVVGHSNTVDDIVNRFVGTAAISDLPDTEYGSLFIVKKKGGSYSFQKISVPKTTQR